ncbi:MAG: 5-formyltetrahydrofolate cyclo-ligase [Lentimonas sp.]|jgi:5-formyltetrahydrofolate cyclo-ligase
MNLIMNKPQIRKLYLEERLKLDKEQLEIKSKMIANNFIKILLPRIDDFSSKKLAFYVAANNEADPIHLIKYCQNLGNITLLPKIKEGTRILDFKPYQNGDKLINNKIYPKLLEPEDSQENIIPDIIFTPLIAFDEKCHRIGAGGGFYDATINNYKQGNIQQIFIGIAFEEQEHSNIISDEWDQKLDFIILPERILALSQ